MIVEGQRGAEGGQRAPGVDYLGIGLDPRPPVEKRHDGGCVAVKCRPVEGSPANLYNKGSVWAASLVDGLERTACGGSAAFARGRDDRKGEGAGGELRQKTNERRVSVWALYTPSRARWTRRRWCRTGVATADTRWLQPGRCGVRSGAQAQGRAERLTSSTWFTSTTPARSLARSSSHRLYSASLSREAAVRPEGHREVDGA